MNFKKQHIWAMFGWLVAIAVSFSVLSSIIILELSNYRSVSTGQFFKLFFIYLVTIFFFVFFPFKIRVHYTEADSSYGIVITSFLALSHVPVNSILWRVVIYCFPSTRDPGPWLCSNNRPWPRKRRRIQKGPYPLSWIKRRAQQCPIAIIPFLSIFFWKRDSVNSTCLLPLPPPPKVRHFILDPSFFFSSYTNWNSFLCLFFFFFASDTYSE